jgi:hypothetical protein
LQRYDPRMRGSRFFVPVIALVVVASACSSSGSSKKSDPAADLTVAKGAVLTKADMPSGFDSSPHDASGGPPDAAKLAFANCLNTKVDLFTDAPGEQKAYSDDFSNTSTNVFIENEVDVYPDKKTINDGYTVLTKSNAPNCVAELVKSTIAASGNGTNPITNLQTSAQTLPLDKVGDRAVGFRTTIHFTQAGQDQSGFLDLIQAQKDRAVVDLTTTVESGDSPYDVATEAQLVNKVIARIDDQVK